ncbi:MAG: T9SS type A sorting domain-containing protein [Draconibacterium sp.]
MLSAFGYSGTLQWSTGATTASITVTEPGSYTVTQTAGGCTSDAAIAIAAPKIGPTLSVAETDPEVCKGEGLLEFSFTEVPDGEYTIKYDQGEFNNVSVSNGKGQVSVLAGSYFNLTIEINGCSSPLGVNAVLSSPDAPEPPQLVIQDNCGESVLTATNYDGTLYWNTGETKETIVVTEPGIYLVTQTLNGCISEAASIQASPEVIPTLSALANLPENCAEDGSIDLILTGVPDGSYAITYDGGSFADVQVNNGTTTIPAKPGTYENLVITVGNCSSASGENVTIESKEPPQKPVISVEEECGQSILTASNYTGTLLWSTNETSESIIVKDAGIYSVNQTVDGCTSDTATVSVIPKSIPSLSVVKHDPEECFGQGSIDFTFTSVPDGNYIIFYNGGSFPGVPVSNGKISVLANAGSYNNLTITVDGCTSPAGINASLSSPDAPEKPSIDIVNNCGESVLTASNYTGNLLWSTNETTKTITINEVGEYSVTQTVDGCVSEAASVTASTKPVPAAPDFSVSNNCNSTSVLTATDFQENAILNWNTGETTETIEVNTAGIYTLKQIVDGCESPLTSKLAEPGAGPSLNVSATDPESCQDKGTLEFIFSGVPNGTYLINYDGGSFAGVTVSNNSATVSADAGTYENLIISVNECSSPNGVSATLTSAGAPNAPSILVENYCGESVLTASDYTGTLLWSTGETTESIIVTEAGTYTVTQTLGSCTSSPKTVLAEPIPALPKPDIEVISNCIESTLQINNLVSDGWLIWRAGAVSDSTKSTTINVPQAGEYKVIQKQGSCSSEEITVIVDDAATPSPPISKGDKEICETKPLQVLTAEAEPPSNSFEVVWFDDPSAGKKITSPTLNSVGSITYYAETQSSSGECTSKSRTPVKLTINPGPTSEAIDTAIVGKPANNVAVLIFPDNSMKYKWSLNNTEISGATGQYYYIPASNRKNNNVFTVEVETDNGCKAQFDFRYSATLTNNGFSSLSQPNPLEIGSSFILYPNPGKEKVYLGLNSNEAFSPNELNIKVFSADGSCIIQMPFNQIPQSINTKELRPGTYSVVIYRNNDWVDTKRLLITQ